jgi:hypothetical protein
VPEAVTVWAVELGEGSSQTEVKGVLSLDRETLRFTPAREGRAPIEVPLTEVVKTRRLRGSPVLLVQRRREGGPLRTAFYFVQPPSLEAYLGQQTGGTVLSSLRNPKRKARRQNVGYLGTMNRAKKAELAEWERAVREAVAAARGT